MKKRWIACLVILLFGFTSVKAQGILDKIDRTLNKADRAANAADRTKNTGGKLAGLFGKKKDKDAANAETETTIKLTGVDFTTLKATNESVQSGKGIASTKMKFSSAGSTIVVQHEGSTEDLLKVLQKASPTIFAEKNIEELDESKISIKIK